MNINKELLEKIAKNARLKLSESEKEEFESQLSDILKHFQTLDQLDTKNAEPSFQPVNIPAVFREDKTGKCLTQDQALSNTKHKKDGFFKGPKV